MDSKAHAQTEVSQKKQAVVVCMAAGFQILRVPCSVIHLAHSLQQELMQHSSYLQSHRLLCTKVYITSYISGVPIPYWLRPCSSTAQKPCPQNPPKSFYLKEHAGLKGLTRRYASFDGDDHLK